MSKENAALGKENAALKQKAEQLGQKADQLEQKAEQLGQKADQLEQINILLETTINLIEKFNTNLPKLIETPTDTKLLASVRSDMVQLRMLKAQWEEISIKTTYDEYRK